MLKESSPSLCSFPSSTLYCLLLLSSPVSSHYAEPGKWRIYIPCGSIQSNSEQRHLHWPSMSPHSVVPLWSRQMCLPAHKVALGCCARVTFWLGCHKLEELICPAAVGWILRRPSMLTELLLPHQSLQTSSCPQPPGSVVDASNFSAALVAPVSVRL